MDRTLSADLLWAGFTPKFDEALVGYGLSKERFLIDDATLIIADEEGRLWIHLNYSPDVLRMLIVVHDLREVKNLKCEGPIVFP